jgi:aminoglycoside phosphotransferase family enzyme/predicted kinase
MSENRLDADMPHERKWQHVAEALAAGEVAGAEAGEIFETHISYVVVGPDRVYKLKKPIRLPFVDYATPERRREMCVREHELNRRLAPSLYVGVSGVRSEPEGLALCDVADPNAFEFVVIMNRVDASQTLESRVDRLVAQPRDLEEVGRVLARFHAEAPIAPAPAGSPERWREWAETLMRGLREAPGEVLSTDRVQAACSFLGRWLDAAEPLLRQRLAAGHVRDVHGDLRVKHVVFTQDSVAVLDCVEFDDLLRCNDVLADLSFLVMELQYAEREDLTRALLKAWEQEGGPMEESLLWAYATTRALIRVEVGLARIEQLRPEGPSVELRLTEELTQTLLDLALRLSWRARPPHVIIFAGLSGSGKSSISRVLSERWGVERISSDETRKRLVGVARNDAAPHDAYEDIVSRAVYERLGREAGREITGGRSVIVDATFRRPSDAQVFVRALRSAGALTPPITLACIAPPEVLRERVRARAERGGSDAGLDVLEAQLSEAQETPLGISGALSVSTQGSFIDALQRAERVVLEHTVTTNGT